MYPPSPSRGSKVTNPVRRPPETDGRDWWLGSGWFSRYGQHVFRGKGTTADPPVATLDFLDHHPRIGTQFLALDRDHRVSQFADHVPLLSGREDALDDFHGYQRHSTLQ